MINDKEYNQSDKINFKKIITQNNDGSLTGIEIINSKLLIIYYRDWQEKLNRYVLLQLVGDKVEILPVATAFPFLPPEAYENNNPNPSSNE
ncbi:MAG: hypothetical protein R2798_08065 [Chitinophagales bacterium]|nr:hypothetical protein [Bacteroidota bacterium]MCB9042389.1 hypothetical protein [Chitinophagales bacterium]